MKLKIAMLGVTCMLLNACATTSVNNSDTSDCTGLSTLEVNNFDKKSHLFNSHDSYYHKYANATHTSIIEVLGCKRLIDGQKRVTVFSDGYRYGQYLQANNDQKVFETFIAWANQPTATQQQTLAQINEKITTFSITGSTTPKSKPNWYVDIEGDSKQPVLVANATDPGLHGLLSNRTMALTKEDATALLQTMTTYWRK